MADRSLWVVGALFLAAAAAALAITRAGDDGLLERDPVLAAMISQTAHQDRRAPGFWLQDAKGRIVGLDDFAGRPIVLAFWGPGAPKSARALLLLRELAAEHHDAGLACIAVCVDRDAAAFRPFAHEAGESVVVLWDRGRHFGDGLEWSDSPLTVCYGVTAVPSGFLIDRDRTLVATMDGEHEFDMLRPRVARMVAER